VAQVLEGSALAAGGPLVQAGGRNLDRRVRWVHVGEVPDIAGLLQGGELVLTTGIGMPNEPSHLHRYVHDLAAVAAAGLVIELGRAFDELPAALVEAAEEAGLPLISLKRVVRFVAITEEVHGQILSEQFEALRASEQAHQVFTSLCVQGASAADIVHEASRMTGVPVVFENLMHQVLSYEAREVSAEELLRDWETHSRATRDASGTIHGGPKDWLVTRVEARGEMFGRLVALAGPFPSPVQVMTLERAAIALTLNRLLEHHRESLERQAHRSTLTDLIEQRYVSKSDMAARASSLGVPLTKRDLVSIVVDVPASMSAITSLGRPQRDDCAEALAAAVRERRMLALIGTLREGRVALLLTLPPGGNRESALRRLAASIHQRFTSEEETAVVAVGATVHEIDEVAGAIAEAEHVATAARGSQTSQAFYELPDIELRGLLYVLGDDPRIQAFVERSLGPLLGYDDRHHSDLVATLRAFLDHSGNKSAAADSTAMSRQAFYRRLDTIARILQVDLDSAETCTSLHAAMIALESMRTK